MLARPLAEIYDDSYCCVFEIWSDEDDEICGVLQKIDQIGPDNHQSHDEALFDLLYFCSLRHVLLWKSSDPPSKHHQQKYLQVDLFRMELRLCLVDFTDIFTTNWRHPDEELAALKRHSDHQVLGVSRR